MESNQKAILTIEEQTEIKIQRLRDNNSAYKTAVILPFFDNRYALVRKQKGKVYTIYSLLSCKFMQINKKTFVNLTREKGGIASPYLLESLVKYITGGADSIGPLTEYEIKAIYKSDYEKSMLTELIEDSEEVKKLPVEALLYIQESEKGRIEYKEARHTAASNGRLEAHFIATIYSNNDNSVITKSLPRHIVKGCYTITDISKLSDIVRAELKALL